MLEQSGRIRGFHKVQRMGDRKYDGLLGGPMIVRTHG